MSKNYTYTEPQDVFGYCESICKLDTISLSAAETQNNQNPYWYGQKRYPWKNCNAIYRACQNALKETKKH